jgi:hypothetical protein
MSRCRIGYRSGHGERLPNRALVGVAETIVAVVSPAIKPVPPTETVWVEALTFSVLLATTMPALRLPTDCGVNCSETLHGMPLFSDVLSRHWLVLLVGCEK